jgi:predicted RNA-binding protein with RPS1 domain
MSSDASENSANQNDLPQKSDSDQTPQEGAADNGSSAAERKSRILIGSQRDPGVGLPRKNRDWYVPGQEDAAETAQSPASPPATPVVETPPPVASPPVAAEMPIAASPTAPTEKPVEEPAPASVAAPISESVAPPVVESALVVERVPAPPAVASGPGKHFPPPNIRGQLPADLEAELEAALGGQSLDDLMAGDEAVTSQTLLEADTKYAGRVIAVQRDDVFVELGGREQGIVPLRSFTEAPDVGSTLEVRVVRYNAAEGLYELSLPHAAASIGDWSDLAEGMVVEARITGHNTGGLECEVNHIRGFIPISQISLYRVENLAEFVGEKFTCLVTEANPDRHNLVLSHRAILEREKEEARTELLKSLAPGQIREGVVRKLMDFGAFVDLGGIDGLLHISQLGWGRVAHPRDVLTEGQAIKVKIEKIDLEANRISLGYRDMLESPWQDVDRKFPVNTLTKGKVTKLMEFGAFVELEPGVEGLVHISELSHKRVWRASDVVHEGDEVEVMVKSIDKAAQRIGLSMKDALPQPETKKETEPTEEDLAAAMPKPIPRKSNSPLKGGLGRAAGGEQFGLKW